MVEVAFAREDITSCGVLWRCTEIDM